jgi:hypothetical protein
MQPGKPEAGSNPIGSVSGALERWQKMAFSSLKAFYPTWPDWRQTSDAPGRNTPAKNLNCESISMWNRLARHIG